MELFPFKPNWITPITERLEWLTDVIITHDDTEERISLRVNPRRYFEYAVTITKNEAARFDALLWQSQTAEYYVPIWTDGQKLTAQLSSSSTTIPATTTDYDFEADYYAVLMTDYETYEVVNVTAVGASSITISPGTTATWEAGTQLYPCRTGRLPETVSKHMHTAQIMHAMVKFEMEGSTTFSEPTPDTYQSTEVFTRKLNWISGQPFDYVSKINRLDYAAGIPYVDDLPDLAKTIQTYQTTLVDRADIADWRGWLYLRKGRYADLWMPQWKWALEQTAPTTAASEYLTIKAVDYVDAYGADIGRGDIAMLHKDGTWIYRRIMGISPSGSDEVLRLDSAVGVDADPGDFKMITWLMPSRQETDGVEIAWHTSTLATCKLQFRSLNEWP